MATTERKKSVGVIGLGPAGLATVKELKNSGCFGVVTGFDRCSRVGGRWSLDTENYDAGVWKELCANTTRRHMEFSDFPWDVKDGYEGQDLAYEGIYPHCTEIRAYLEAYARNFDLYPNLRLETEVTSIEKTESGWKITTKNTTNGTTAHDFDAIVVCNGAQNKAYHPLEAKLRDFAGDVLHSQNFRSMDDYKDKSVLVVGGNVSGSEIASTLADGKAASVVHSMRKMPYHMQKFTKTTNTAYEDHLFVRLPAWLDRVLPASAGAKGLQSNVLQFWPEQCTTEAMPNCSVGITPDIQECGGSVSRNYVDLVKKGCFDVKPEVASVDGKKVVFADGTSDSFDVIICATGYDFDVSFLPETVQQKVRVLHPSTGKNVMNLYKHTLVPNRDLVDNLAFCGLISSIGAYFPLTEMQARYISAIWSKQIPCPSLTDLQRNAEASMNKKMDSSSVLNNFEVSTVVNELLGDELGVTPSLAKAFSNPKKYLLGPVYACYYRTNEKAIGGDPEVAKQCQKRFDGLIASSPQVPNQTDVQMLVKGEGESLTKFIILFIISVFGAMLLQSSGSSSYLSIANSTTN